MTYGYLLLLRELIDQMMPNHTTTADVKLFSRFFCVDWVNGSIPHITGRGYKYVLEGLTQNGNESDRPLFDFAIEQILSEKMSRRH